MPHFCVSPRIIPLPAFDILEFLLKSWAPSWLLGMCWSSWPLHCTPLTHLLPSLPVRQQTLLTWVVSDPRSVRFLVENVSGQNQVFFVILFSISFWWPLSFGVSKRKDTNQTGEPLGDCPPLLTRASLQKDVSQRSVFDQNSPSSQELLSPAKQFSPPDPIPVLLDFHSPHQLRWCWQGGFSLQRWATTLAHSLRGPCSQSFPPHPLLVTHLVTEPLPRSTPGPWLDGSWWPLGSWSHIKYRQVSWKTPELERPSVLSRGNRKSALTLGSAGHTEGLCHTEKAQEQRAAPTDARHSVCTLRGTTVSQDCELLGTGTMSYSRLFCCAQHVQVFNE